MQFGHKQLDVYQVSIRYLASAYQLAKGVTGIERHAREERLCASKSIPLSPFEGGFDDDNEGDEGRD